MACGVLIRLVRPPTGARAVAFFTLMAHLARLENDCKCSSNIFLAF